VQSYAQKLAGHTTHEWSALGRTWERCVRGSVSIVNDNDNENENCKQR